MLFRTIVELRGSGSGAGGGSQGAESTVREALSSYLSRLPSPFNMVEVRLPPALSHPFHLVYG